MFEGQFDPRRKTGKNRNLTYEGEFGAYVIPVARRGRIETLIVPTCNKFSRSPSQDGEE